MSGPSTASPPAAPITIRAYHPDDYAEVVHIFTDGMRGLALVFMQRLLGNWRTQVAAVAATAILCAAIGRTVGPFAAVPAAILVVSLLLLALYLYFRYQPMESYVQSSLKDDLADISAAYDPSNGSRFWVAEQAVAGARPRVVGCVGLQHKSADSAELRRMSVGRACRRGGVGRRLAEALIQHAREAGFKQVVLGTTSLQEPAIRLYQALGWQQESSTVIFGGLLHIQHFVLKLAP